jgi:hypothetical protein
MAILAIVAMLGGFSRLNAQCVPTYTVACTSGDFIDGVIFNTISNLAQGCNGQVNNYRFYNTLSTTVVAGLAYTLQVNNTPSWNQGVAAWIDYNQNNVFETSERIMATTGTYAGQGTTANGGLVTVTIPASALGGTTRLRVRCGFGVAGTTIDPCANVTFGETEDYVVVVAAAGVTNSFPGTNNFPGITTSGIVLQAGLVFDGSTTAFPKPSVIVDRLNATGFSQRFRYQIIVVNASPLAADQVVYEMRDPANPSSANIPVPAGTTPWTFISGSATGVASRSTPNDGTFLTTTIPGGSYRVSVVHELLQGTTVIATQNYSATFSVAVQRDISAFSIESPLPQRRQSYIRTQPIPIRAKFRNTGLDTVTRYRAYYEIRRALDNSLVRIDSVERSTDVGGGLDPVRGLPTGVDDEVTIGNFVSNSPDSFCISVRAQLLETRGNQFAQDQQSFNDVFPQTSCGYRFRVWYLVDFEPLALLIPSTSTILYAGRPIKPLVNIANNGLFVDQIPVTITVRLNGNLLTTETKNVEVPSGSFNTALVDFTEFTPPQSGTLEICIRTSAASDEFAANDERCFTFNINDRMIGNYTIGSVPRSGIENFSTIDAAVNALFQRGVRGPVTFILTDQFYSVGPNANDQAALDLASNYIGGGQSAPVTFMPDTNTVGLLRGGVTIQLNSGNGIGVNFGQSSTPANVFAVYRDFPVKANANAPGYITFDGGPQKAFRFRLRSVANRRAVFYFGPRTYNTAVKNCLIEMDPSTPEIEYWDRIPTIGIDQSNLVFTRDSLGSAATFQTFSAGIVQRNIPPADQFGSNRLGLDTAIVENNITYRGNKANVIQDNEITGFGFGVISLGMGVLKERNRLVRYYNSGTVISGNRISKVGRTGIFLGYEDGSVVTGNKIYNVLGIGRQGTTQTFIEAAGIEAGMPTDTLTSTLGYNNINLEISNNEINDVTSRLFTRGIKVNQSQNNFNATGILENTIQPNVPERARITGNFVWGLTRGTIAPNGAINRVGIHLLTDRQAGTSATALITPRTTTNPAKDARNYFTREDLIANNTVWIDEDGLAIPGAAVGVMMQNAMNTRFMNNAVAVTANLNANTIALGLPIAAVGYQGLHPKFSGGLRSDYNAIWTNNQGSFMRFIEIDTISQILVQGYQDEYQTRDQWFNWTGQGQNSFTANFLPEHVVSGVSPLQFLRIRKTPRVVGSKLNNAGIALAGVTSDLEGDLRGSAGNRPDIGADEFDGVPYVNDVEVVNIAAPRAYRSGTGGYPNAAFSDVEYVMTDTTNIPMVVRLRNNSTLSQTVSLTGTVALENASTSANATPTYGAATPVGTVSVIIAAGETKEVTVGSVALQTLQQLGTGYSTPSWMQQAVDASMRPNVTPRYRFNASIANLDEDMSNNANSSEARFYVMQSKASRFAISVEGSGYPHISTVPSSDVNYTRNTIGRLNSDSLRVALDSLGFFSDPTRSANRTFRFDIIDRYGWEPRTVNYTGYKMLIWAQDNTAMARTEREQLRDYLSAGNTTIKKNLIIASQEIAPAHVGLNATNDEFFVRNQLRAIRGRNTTNGFVTTPVVGGYTPTVVANGASFVEGIFVMRGLRELVSRTGFTNATFTDPNPNPSVLDIYTDAASQGLARRAFRYTTRDAVVRDSAMGIVNTAPTMNVAYYGIDWRHFAKSGVRTGTERILRGTFDYIQFNDGRVTPVELVDFDARRAGKAVAINWATASEMNSGWYEVERAEQSVEGLEFERIETVPAAGNSSVRREYAAVDANVRTGATYIYRLKMVDRDGSFKYSDEVAVIIGESSDAAVAVSEVRPNPVVNAAAFEYTVKNSGLVQVSVTDMMGREVVRIFNGTVNGGTYTLNVDTDNLTSGMYQIVVKAGDKVATRALQVVK